jgi:hypothetical protein
MKYMRGTRAEPWMNESVADGPYEVETGVTGWMVEGFFMPHERAAMHELDGHDHLMCGPEDQTPEVTYAELQATVRQFQASESTHNGAGDFDTSRVFYGFDPAGDVEMAAMPRNPRAGDVVRVRVGVDDDGLASHTDPLRYIDPQEPTFRTIVDRDGVVRPVPLRDWQRRQGEENLAIIQRMAERGSLNERMQQMRRAINDLWRSMAVSLTEATRTMMQALAQVWNPHMTQIMGEHFRERLLQTGKLELTDQHMEALPHLEEIMDYVLNDLECEIYHDDERCKTIFTIWGGHNHQTDPEDWQIVGYTEDGQGLNLQRVPVGSYSVLIGRWPRAPT